MNSTDLYDLSRHAEFRERVLIIVAHVCHTVLNEAADVEKTAERKRYANMTLNNSIGYTERWAVSLAADQTIAESISINETTPETLDYSGTEVAVSVLDGADVEILNAVNRLFNDLAGVY